MDDLLDIDWGSSAGVKPKQPALTLAQQQQQQQQQQGAAPSTGQSAASTYNFDALTRSMPAASTPLYGSSRAGTPSDAGRSAAVPGSVKPNTTSSGTASFADLVNFGNGSSGVGSNGSATLKQQQDKSSSTMAGMSMLDRAKAQAARSAGPPPSGVSSNSNPADAQMWDFDAFSSSTNTSTAPSLPARPSAAPSTASARGRDTGSKPPASSSTSSASGPHQGTSLSNRDIFSLLDEDHSSSPSEQAKSSALPRQAGNGNTVDSSRVTSQDPFDFDSFDSAAPSSDPIPNVPVGGSQNDEDDDFLGALGKPVEPKPAREPTPPPAKEQRDRVRNHSSSPLFDGGSSTSSRAPSLADGGRKAYHDRSASSSAKSSREPAVSKTTLEDEERAARERDEAILGGPPPGAAGSSRRQRDAGNSSGTGTPSLTASLFGGGTEENLLGALGRTLGFGAPKSGTQSRASRPHTPPPASGAPAAAAAAAASRLRAERTPDDGSSTPGTTSSRAPSPAAGGRSRYRDQARQRAEDGGDDARARDDAILGGGASLEEGRRSTSRRQQGGAGAGAGSTQFSHISAKAASLFGGSTSGHNGASQDGDESNLFGALGKAVKNALGVPGDDEGSESRPSRGTNSLLDRLRAEVGAVAGSGERSARGSRGASPALGSRGGGYRDGSDDEDDGPTPATERRQQTKAPSSEGQNPFRDGSKDNDDAQTSSPAPRPSRRPQAQAGSRPAPASSRPEPIRVPRSIVTDSSSAIATSAKLKAQGNDAFKRGAYGEAESHYTQALEVLEEGSLRRVPLLNNRAQARLKNGEAVGASRDCEASLAIIVPPSKARQSQAASVQPGGGTTTAVYRPREEMPLPEPLASEVNLRDAWAKAVLRRAQASESLERWVSARRDWDALLVFEREEGSGRAGVANMRSAKEGLARCEEMISGKKKTKTTTDRDGDTRRASGRGASAPSTRSNLASSQTGSVRQSASTAAAIARAGEAGVARVRQEAAAQAAEEAAKLSLKDGVDEAVGRWKAGKESNVRGLLASVETVVVWPEMGWKKVGMHELITDAQVKKAYTRAIARLHPDKLSSKNTTLEQRLVASAVFTALNEAFTASQPS